MNGVPLFIKMPKEYFQLIGLVDYLTTSGNWVVDRLSDAYLLNTEACRITSAFYDARTYRMIRERNSDS